MHSTVLDSTTYLLLIRSEGHQRRAHAAAHARAVRVARLRRLHRKAQSAVRRARLARLAVG